MEIEITDESLAEAAAHGDADAFGVLVERYQPKLLRYGRKFLPRDEDIEDIVQDALIRAYENLKSFDASRRFSPWMYQIAHNAFVNALRKHSRGPFTLFDFDTFISHQAAEPERDYERESAEMRRLIDRGLDALAPKAREVLVLYYLEGFSYTEIADILQVPAGTVGVRLKRARDALRAAYETMDISSSDIEHI